MIIAQKFERVFTFCEPVDEHILLIFLIMEMIYRIPGSPIGNEMRLCWRVFLTSDVS